MISHNGWDIVYEKAIRDDGSLFFPERLSHEFLQKARRTMGSFLFANQYQNEIVPDDEKKFKKEWLKFYSQIPSGCLTFVFIDPAIGQNKRHDYTGICVVQVDCNGTWYLPVASRQRLTPTEIVEKIFEINVRFKPVAIGIEVVAYQEALLYFLAQEMNRRQTVVPIKGIKRSQVSKETRILGLVPRFEWNRIFINHGLTDFEDEYEMFPRGTHDDILDALTSLEEIVHYPQKQETKIERPNGPSDPNYERWYIQELLKRAQNPDHTIQGNEYTGTS